jgi:hypothetical protein
MDNSDPSPEVPPIVVDIDGTLTDADRVVDHRVWSVLQDWPTPVIVATGKAMPYPIALCDFGGIPTNVIAENGGVAYVEASNEITFTGDREAAQAVAEDYRAEGYDLGWPTPDFSNRWRETELAVARDQPLEPLERVAEKHGLEVIDSQFAYHVKSPHVDKGTALQTIAGDLGYDPSDFAAVGDSENDAATFELVGHAIAVANADETALATADQVTEASYADGFLEAVDLIRDRG